MKHLELCFDLASAKGSYFVEVPLGSVWLDIKNGLGIADVVTVKPSYTKFNVDIYECKVSRADALQDIKARKYEKYLPHCHRLYFATHGNLIDKDELPYDVGLVVRGEKGWRTVKPAAPREVEIPEQTLLSLLFYRGRLNNKHRVNLRYANSIRDLADARGNLKNLSKKVKQAIVDYPSLLTDYHNLRHATKEFKPENKFDQITISGLKDYQYL